ncbi:MAG: hypothetical protein ACKO96_46445, partial [Flammeovirgaceae bacterium]
AALCLLPLLAYWFQFKKYDVSREPEDWIQFWGLYIGALNLFLTGAVAYVVYRLTAKTAIVNLQYEAYGEFVLHLSSLTNEIKPLTQTNEVIEKRIVDTLRKATHFFENYTFIFPDFDKNKITKFQSSVTRILNEIRKEDKNLIFGQSNNFGTEIINSTNDLIFDIQKSMVNK